MASSNRSVSVVLRGGVCVSATGLSVELHDQGHFSPMPPLIAPF